MSFLQQLSIPPLFLPREKGRQQESVAIHRRLKTILSFDAPDFRFDVFEAGGIDIDQKWSKIGSFYLPESLKQAKVVVSLTIESLDSFLLVLLKDNITFVLFLDAKNGDFIAISELSSDVIPICADMDQNTRELHMGFSKGIFVSFTLRLTAPTGNRNNNAAASNQGGLFPPSKKTIQTISRKQSKMRQLLASSLGDTEKFTFHQITHSDVINVALFLSEQGSITCVESTDHEVLWIVRRDSFVRHPVWLWMDKFGSDFCVLCLDPHDTLAEGETLEYWRPPIDYTSMQGGEFQRVQLPLTDTLVGLAMETLHPGLDLVVMCVTVNDHVQCFRSDDKLGGMTLATEFFLTGGVTSSQLKLKNKRKQDSKKGRKSVSISSRHSSTSGTAAETTSAKPPSRGKFPPRFAGVATFVKGTDALPDIPAVFLSSCYSSICTVGIHLPSPADYAYQKTCMFVAASQLEATFLPDLGMSNMDNRRVDELGAFLMRQPPVQPLPHPHHISPALLDTNDNNNDLDEGVYHDSMGRRVSGGGLALEPGLLEEGSTRTLNLNSQSVVSGVSKMGFMTGVKAVASSDYLMSAALLDADKEIESLCSDPQQQSWIRSQENSVESLNALNKRQALGGAIGGLLGFSQSQYGAPSQGQLSPGLDTRSQMSLTGGMGMASSMSFGDDIDDALPLSARSRPASIERDSRSHPEKAEAKDGDISPLNDDKQQQHQGDDEGKGEEGKGEEGKGEGKDDEHKSADE